ncbi:MAG TPA: divergent polysaccharide deacetylase family protein [Xanthobacteraceae bacterium]|nr:divergent polysaccharide deacetylase family protein [Xanthobacteraceae bacterium]
MTDDLSAPLGQGIGRKRDKTSERNTWVAAIAALWPRMLAAALGCFALIFLGWFLFADAPLGGEPMVVVAANLHADAAGPDAKTIEANPGHAAEADRERPNRYDGPPIGAGQPAAAAGRNMVTIIDGSSGKREDVVIPGQQADKPAAAAPADQRFAEATRSGPIPRIAPDGTRPSEAFAQPVKTLPDRPNAPRIAIVVAGLGISAIGTSDALAKLPGPVTFGFAPYGADLDHLAARAREGGHEILLQVPMEPFDYPDNDPGPQTLLTSLNATQNIERLHWLMSRLQGYVGLANYMGGRFTATETALAPILREAAKRGLIYVEDGSSPRSVASQLAGASNLPYAKADLTIDAVPTAAEIDRSLSRLEKTARDRGFAVGVASALPASIEHIAVWAKAAESRGLLLVPISAVAARGKST